MPQTILHSWKNIQLAELDVELPNGQTIRHTSIIHPGAAVILPIMDNGDILLLKQYRPSLGKWILELPAGTIENETPLSCAQRELNEETGYTATDWLSLGVCTPLAGFCDEIQHLFVAKGLHYSPSLLLDDDEVIEIIIAPVNKVEDLIRSNELTDAKTIACLSKAKLCGFLN